LDLGQQNHSDRHETRTQAGPANPVHVLLLVVTPIERPATQIDAAEARCRDERALARELITVRMQRSLSVSALHARMAKHARMAMTMAMHADVCLISGGQQM
jgi:hypothetical protein